MKARTLKHGLKRAVALVASAALIGGAFALAGSTTATAAPFNVTGLVVDAAGNPVSGSVTFDNIASGASNVYAYTSAGEINATVPAGQYKVIFDPYDNDKYEVEYYLDQTTWDLGATVVVPADAPLALSTWVINRTPFITGLVTDPAGKPLADVSVTASPATGTSSKSWSTSTRTDGTYELSIGATSFGPNDEPIYSPIKVYVGGSGDYVGEWFNDKGTAAAADSITAAGTGTAIGTTVLTKGATLSGVVTSDAGVPLEYVRVCLISDTATASSECSSATKSTYTANDGTYVFKGVAEGSYGVFITDPLDEYYAERWDNIIMPDYAANPTPTPTPSPSPTPGKLAVTKDLATSLPTVTLTPKPAKTTAPVDLTGKVTDAAGRVMPGVQVTAYTVNADQDQKKALETVRTNRAGVYSFTHLGQVPAAKTVKIEVGGYSTGKAEEDYPYYAVGEWWKDKQSYVTADVVNAPQTAPMDFVLDWTGAVSGVVTSEVAKSVAGGSVSLYTDQGVYVSGASIKADGTYLIPYVEAGDYLVRFSARDHVTEYWDNTVRDMGKMITVTPQTTTTGVNAALAGTLLAYERPEISTKYAWVGSALTVSDGMWNGEGNSAKLTYEWMTGTTVLGTGPTYTPKATDLGKKLMVKVSAQNGSLLGSAVTEETYPVGYTTKLGKAKVVANTATMKVSVAGVKAKAIKGTLDVFVLSKLDADGNEVWAKIGKGTVNKVKPPKGLSKKAKKKAKKKLEGVASVKWSQKSLAKGMGETKETVKFVFYGQNPSGSCEATTKIKLKDIKKKSKR